MNSIPLNAPRPLRQVRFRQRLKKEFPVLLCLGTQPPRRVFSLFHQFRFPKAPDS